MRNERKTKTQLIYEVAELRQRVVDLEQSEARYVAARLAFETEDITKRRETQNSLKESELKYRTLIETSSDIICLKDIEGRYMIVNPALARRMGLPEREIIGKNASAFYSEELASRIWKTEEKVLKDGRVVDNEYKISTPKGLKFFRSRKAPVRNESGLVVGLVSIGRDVTERKQAEEALTESELKFRQMAENSRDVFWMEDHEYPHRILYLSPSYEDIWGRSTKVAYERPLDWMDAIHSDDIERVKAARKARESTGEFDTEYRIVRPDGSIRWVNDRSFPIWDDKGLLYRAAGIVEDITERKQIQEELNRYSKRLEVLRDIDQAILAARTPEEIADVVLRHISLSLPYHRTSVNVFDVGASEVQVLAEMSNTETQIGGGTVIPLGYLGDIEDLHDNETRVVGDLAAIPQPPPVVPLLLAAGVRSTVIVPLLVGLELIGSLNLGSDKPNAYSAEHVELAREVGYSLAVALYNARLLRETRSRGEELQALSHRLVDVQETERRNLAGELHDEIGQSLTGLNFILTQIDRLPTDKVRVAAAEARTVVSELTHRVQELSLDLRPSMLDDLGLLPALLWHFDRYSAQTKIKVGFKHSGLDRRFHSDMEITLYRVIQEALTNVARHANVNNVTVKLWAGPDDIKVQVKDDGQGFDMNSNVPYRHTNGLAGMRERVERVGGQLDINSALGHGTVVTAEFPVGWSESDEQWVKHGLGSSI